MDYVKLFSGYTLATQGGGEFSRPIWSDFSLVLPSIFIVAISNQILVPIFKKIGFNLLSKNSGEKIAKESGERIHFFGQRLYSLIFHGLSSAFCFYAFHNEWWWFETKGYPFAHSYPEDNKYSFNIKLYYNIELGYVIYKSFSLLCERYIMGIRKEFTEMAIHHIVTLLLVIFSFIEGYAYPGILIFFLHNFSDVFTYICRCSNDVNSVVAMFALPLMLISWIVIRLYFYPVYAINGCVLMLGGGNWINQNYYTLFPLVSLACILYCLHVYWVYGMFRVNYKVFSKEILKYYYRKTESKDIQKIDGEEKGPKVTNGNKNVEEKV